MHVLDDFDAFSLSAFSKLPICSKGCSKWSQRELWTVSSFSEDANVQRGGPVNVASSSRVPGRQGDEEEAHAGSNKKGSNEAFESNQEVMTFEKCRDFTYNCVEIGGHDCGGLLDVINSASFDLNVLRGHCVAREKVAESWHTVDGSG